MNLQKRKKPASAVTLLLAFLSLRLIQATKGSKDHE